MHDTRAKHQEEVNMKYSVILGTMTAAGLAAGAAMAGTLDDVQARGKLNCGVTTGLTGFAEPDANGVWQGFDVGVCRAVAAAVLGDPMAVEFVPLTAKVRFTALNSGEIDMLARNTTWTFSRDVDLKLDFIGVNYYDGQGFMVPTDLGVSSAADLDGATVCIQVGTTTELNLADFFRVNNISYEPVPVETGNEGQQKYFAGACDVIQRMRPRLHRHVQQRQTLMRMLYCQKSSQKSHWDRWCATVTTSGAMLYAGR
jgi:general L-amino acid transport system substrate-binding protein